MKKPACWFGVAAVAAAVASNGWAYTLDPWRMVDVRLRAYNQWSVFTQNAAPDSPERSSGDFAQSRTFYNPELDIKLRDRLGPFADDFKFHFAWWGFYDGVYDYLSSSAFDSPWNEHRQNLKGRFSESDNPLGKSFVFDDQNKNPRHIYASRNRINELYLDWTKGPVFFRVGRQAISWGESDTVALLDVSNPFDLTLGAPGFFQDVEEARIPLWTLRNTTKLATSWGAVTQAFFDAYFVPGPIDTTTPTDPLTGGVSPFSVPGSTGQDPQSLVPPLGIPSPKYGLALIHANTVQRVPRTTWGNSRWGARLMAVINGEYTVQGWFLRTFNQAPAPWLISTNNSNLYIKGQVAPTIVDDRGFRVSECSNIDPATATGSTPAGRACGPRLAAVTLLEHKLESVIGVAASWYSQAIDSVVRTEVEGFLGEASFIPEQNLNARGQIPATFLKAFGENPADYRTSVATADYVRFVVGFDKFFFIRPLNSANTFLLSMAFNGQVNMSEVITGRDYRFPNTKEGKTPSVTGPIPGVAACSGAGAVGNPLCVHTDPKNFTDQYPFEGFLTTVLRTDYMHGRLQPQIVMITDVSGIFGFAPQLTYRITDNFLFTTQYLAVAGKRRYGLGTFAGYNMATARLTFQFN